MPLTRESLTTYLAQNYDLADDELTDDSPLFSSGLLDSFNLLDVISFIESEAGVRIGALDVNLDNLDTVERILRYVEKSQN